MRGVILAFVLAAAFWPTSTRAQCSPTNPTACGSPGVNNLYVGGLLKLNAGLVCDGTTDVTATIQAGITAAAGNATYYIPNTGSACLISARLNVPSNTHLIIDGTILMKAGVNQDMLFTVTNASNIVIEGHGILDGNRATQTTRGAGVMTGLGNSMVVVKDLTIQHMRNWPVNIVNTTGAWLINLTMNDAGNSAEFAQGTNNCHASGLNISNNSDYSFAFYGGVFNCEITNSNLTSGSIDGIIVLSDSGQTVASHDIVIADNVINGMAQAGIGINRLGGGAENHDIVISNNRMSGDGIQTLNGYCGIRILDAQEVLVSGNHISNDGNATVSTPCYGILASGASNDIMVDGNFILNEGQPSSGLGVGIQVGSSCVRCTFQNNTLGDNQGSPTMAFGVGGTPGTGNRIINNTIYGTIGDPYSAVFATDTVLQQIASDAVRVIAAGNGGSITAKPYAGFMQLNTTPGTIAGYTVTAPSDPTLNEVLTITCNGTVTALTFAPNSGQTVNGGSTTCGPALSVRWLWNLATTTWLPI